MGHGIGAIDELANSNVEDQTTDDVIHIASECLE
jgi:hypothetical protein